jgi:hypothetical protein
METEQLREHAIGQEDRVTGNGESQNLEML